MGPLEPGALAEVMSAADVFCLASTNEGWPNVVHEALACGAPVVATDVGAVPELLDRGALRRIVPSNDPLALRRALQEALRRELGPRRDRRLGPGARLAPGGGRGASKMQAIAQGDRTAGIAG